MNPSTAKGLALLILGAALGALATAWGTKNPPPRPAGAAAASVPGSSPRMRPDLPPVPPGQRAPAEAEPDRIAALETRLDQQARFTSDLGTRIAKLSEQLALLEQKTGRIADALDGVPPAAEAPTPRADPVDYSKSPMQRALEAAGLDEGTAESIKLRGDQLAMTEMYLRDQATREGWLDTPRFREEMEAVEAQRTSIRDELGDDAYDRYLFALGRTNRVIVNDVMFESVAEDVGLQSGDLILSYGDARVFAPDELAGHTRQGSAGDPVVLEVVRNGQRLEIEVPRGPLGVRIGTTQDNPDRELGD